MKEHSYNTALTWGLRFLGFLIMFIGFNLAAGIVTLPVSFCIGRDLASSSLSLVANQKN
jgi:divalent metal cation (Fe/Co/Zn/Cd) transporter